MSWLFWSKRDEVIDRLHNANAVHSLTKVRPEMGFIERNQMGSFSLDCAQHNGNVFFGQIDIGCKARQRPPHLLDSICDLY